MPRPALRPSMLLATGFGAGYVPVAPGHGRLCRGRAAFLSSVTPAACLVSCHNRCHNACSPSGCSGKAEKILGTKDPPQVVIDEIAGQLITLALLPPHWTYMLAGFLLFRLFDIIKPWPANKINRDMHGGAGIVLDDVVAGVYANLLSADCQNDFVSSSPFLSCFFKELFKTPPAWYESG